MATAVAPSTFNVSPTSLLDIAAADMTTRSTGLKELDRVLNGGFTRGSVTLLGGEPGIGKSTLVLQLCRRLTRDGWKCLVVTGEESLHQVAQRAQRLNAQESDIRLLAETNLNVILDVIATHKPDLVVIDSIQTMTIGSSGASAGSPTQVRDCAALLTAAAKTSDVAVVLVGHVTKEGALAGPRVLEHVVDTVLEFEGDRHQQLRFLRAVKHRFGSTDEVGVFEMTERGLRCVSDASGLFLDDRRTGTSGSAIVPILQGRRPMLVELQALVTRSALQQPKRLAQGIDGGRLAVIMGVLSCRSGMNVVDNDVYASVVGGIRVDDPGVDLAMALALASAMTDDPLGDTMVAVGEIGLGGEIRKVAQLEKRLRESQRMGFRKAIVPAGFRAKIEGMTLIGVSTLNEALLAVGFVPQKGSGRRGNPGNN